MRSATLTLLAALAAGPPQAGVLVPGERFGALRVGATPAQVEAAWGHRHGVCRSCRHRTWYFNVRRFEPQGVGVEFRRGRAAAFFTLWAPKGWRTSRGLRIGEDAGRITSLYGPLPRRECGGYAALTLPRRETVTVFYVDDGKLWGFALLRKGVPACR